MNGVNFKFNFHPDQIGKHAFLSASKYSWTNYDEDKLEDVFRNSMEAQRGTELHEYAATAIRLRRKQPKTRDTVNMFVNDVIGYRMSSEQILYYSSNVFGTADAISYKNGLLRIFDLKTGNTKASFTQLLVYAALFCLEYDIKPGELQYDLRIYQLNETIPYEQEQSVVIDEVTYIMDKIIRFDRKISQMKMETW